MPITSPDSRLAYETNNYSPRLLPFFDPVPRILPRLPEQLAAAAAAGFGCIVLDSGSLKAYLADGGTLARLSALFSAHSLGCLAIAELSIDTDVEAVLATAEPMLEAAQILGARFLQVGVMGPAEQCIESVRALERRALVAGVQPAIEFMPFGTVGTLRDAESFLARAKLAHTRIVIDTWHFFEGSPDWDALEHVDVARIAWVQVSDRGGSVAHDPLYDTINCRLLPGQGVVDLARLLAVLRRIGFTGTTSCEVLSSEWREHEPHFYAAAEAAAMRSLLRTPT